MTTDETSLRITLSKVHRQASVRWWRWQRPHFQLLQPSDRRCRFNGRTCADEQWKYQS